SLPIVVVLCHCIDCSRSSGSVFATNLWYSTENFQVTAGEELLKIYLKPGGQVARRFCSICGSLVFSTAPLQPEPVVFVAAGLLAGDPRPEFTPQKEFFCVHKNKWLNPVKGATASDTHASFTLERTKSTYRYVDVEESVEKVLG
ncbi:DUF636 domain protein, partial [Mycena vulgaris]